MGVNEFLLGAPASDQSSGSMPSGFSTEASGGTWRGIGSSWFNASNVAKEDWVRSEQSANNAYFRQLDLDEHAREFNSAEAQKERDWAQMMRKTAYQDTVESMRAAGINPILAYSQGSVSTPSGSSASAGSGSSSGGYRPSGYSDPMNGVLKLVAGLISTLATGNPASATVISETIDILSNPNDSRSSKLGSRTTTKKYYSR